MDKKDISYADVSRSLNRLDGFIDNFLLTVQSYNEKRITERVNVIVDGHKETMVIYPIDIKKSIIGFIDDVKFNREGDESINYYGIHDCVDYILNNQSLLLAKRAFSIETKIKEAEQVLLSFLSEIKETSDLLWQTWLILCQIEELHIEPFVIPETGDNDSEGDNHHIDDFPDWKDVDNEIKALFLYPANYKDFLRGCFLPNRKVKDIEGIVDSYNRKRVQNEKSIKKGVPTLLYKFLCKIGIISVPEDKPDSKLRSFQRAIEKLKK